MCVYVEVRGQLWVWFLRSCPTYLMRQCLSLGSWGSLIRVGNPEIRSIHHHAQLFTGVMELNSDPLACTAGILPTEPLLSFIAIFNQTSLVPKV